MRSCIGLIIGFVLVHSVQAQENSNPPLSESECVEDRDELLALDFQTFDQDFEKGIRAVASQPGCNLVAADLYNDFHGALRAKGEPVYYKHGDREILISPDGAVPILYWHEGQIRAIEKQNDRAVELFRLSLKPEERNYGAWNEYVLASIAFLEGDLDELKLQRDAMASVVDEDFINLGVVDGLIVCFGKSYQEAYSFGECNRRPGWEQRKPETE